ncbi:unnamed protein product [Closterium sp. Naga37s-1]|nr:unnamed protein product [Closterium sp. Naga37s-1]
MQACVLFIFSAIILVLSTASPILFIPAPVSFFPASLSHFPPSLRPPPSPSCLSPSPPIPSHRDATRAFVSGNFSGFTPLPHTFLSPSVHPLFSHFPFLFHPFPPPTVPYSPIPSRFRTLSILFHPSPSLSIPLRPFPSLSIPLSPAGDGLTDDLTGLSGEQCIGVAD